MLALPPLGEVPGSDVHTVADGKEPDYAAQPSNEGVARATVDDREHAADNQEEGAREECRSIEAHQKSLSFSRRSRILRPQAPHRWCDVGGGS
jgi:hypothetical protein